MRFFTDEARYTEEGLALDLKVVNALREIFDDVPLEAVREIHIIVNGAVSDYVCTRVLTEGRPVER